MSATLICAGSVVGQAANAADMPPLAFPQMSERSGIVQEFASGWYLRGDIGWRSDANIGDVTSNFPLPTNNRIHDALTGGLGAGYKAQWFRFDVTLDYAGKTKYQGDGILPGIFSGKVESLTSLANVYLDLGSWSGFTPYVGVGLGAITFRTFDYQAPAGILTLDYQSHTDFAWAYMVGFAYSFAPRWLVDVSYRRLNHGDVTFNPNLANSLTLKDLTANEFRVGVRYTLD
jgi:opacity protein-like surface antigen